MLKLTTPLVFTLALLLNKANAYGTLAECQTFAALFRNTCGSTTAVDWTSFTGSTVSCT